MAKRRRKTTPRINNQAQARVRAFGAINRVRRGESTNLSSAARAEHITVATIRRLLPSAIAQSRPGGPVRVKASDRYSQRVEILTDRGRLVATAHGSHERELAGRHRATYSRVLEGKKSESALAKFRGKTVGGHKLISDFNRLSILAQAGVLGQLDTLYVSPDASV
jgi:hypothetical protein